jgi:hypothetical protein
MPNIKLHSRIEQYVGKLTICLLDKIRDEISLTGMMKCRDRELEFIGKLDMSTCLVSQIYVRK